MEFIYKNFPKEFYEKTYREHRAKLTFEREQSLFPETQELVRQHLDRKKTEADIERLYEKKNVRKEKIKYLNQIRRELLFHIKETDDPTELKQLKVESKEIWDRLKRKRARITRIEKRIENKKRELLYTGKKTEKKSVFTTRCTEPECKGYVSEDSLGVPKCGICMTVFCKKCLIRMEESLPHTCDKNTRKTIKALKKETRACPKCLVPIYKISGCDQMYCTECHTPFSWITGEIETGRIHNPHYYEYQRRVKGTVEREPGDFGCQPDMTVFYDYFGIIPQVIFLKNLHRLVGHLRDLCRGMFRAPGPNDNENLRVKYLSNEIDKSRFLQALKMRDKKDEKHEVFRMVLGMFADVADTHMKKLELGIRSHYSDEDIQRTWIDVYANIKGLREYTNEVLTEAEKRFKNKVPYINEKFGIDKYFGW